MSRTYITTEIDKNITDYVTRQSLTPLFFAQGEQHPDYPYCEIGILNYGDKSGLNAKDRTKLITLRFRVFTEDGTALKKADELAANFEDYTERHLLDPLVYVGRISDAIPVNVKTDGGYIYSAYIDVNFSYTVEGTEEEEIERISGVLFGNDFDIDLTTE